MEPNNRKKRQERRAEAVAEYKELTRKIREYNRNDPLAEVQEHIRSDLERANELYPIVKRKLDGTSADSKHMRELYKLCQDVSKRINATSRPFELKKIIQGLMRTANEESGESLSKQQFCRYIVEEHVNSFLLTPPTFEFFYGAIKGEDLVVRERRKRTIREKFSDTQAITAKEKDVEVDVEQDTTPKEVDHINTQIRRLARNRREGLPFFKTIVDPESFIHTVENIFHISFLVKEGKIGVKQDQSKTPILTIEDDAPRNREMVREPASLSEGRQSVLSFSMDDYRKWISTYKIEKRSFAPRQDSEDTE